MSDKSTDSKNSAQPSPPPEQGTPLGTVQLGEQPTSVKIPPSPAPQENTPLSSEQRGISSGGLSFVTKARKQ